MTGTNSLRCPACGSTDEVFCDETPKVHRHYCENCFYETVFRGESPKPDAEATGG